MTEISMPVVIQPDEDQYHAWVPTLPGCHTFGRTIDEALANIKEAASLQLEMMNKDGEPLPIANPPVMLVILNLQLAW